MKVFRETRLGRFVTRQQAQADPDHTVGETVSAAPKKLAVALWTIDNLRPALIDAAVAMERAAAGLVHVPGVTPVVESLREHADKAREAYEKNSGPARG